MATPVFENLREILRLAAATAAAGKLRIDPSLARGLGYYTGAIMEINVKDLSGSLAGGGDMTTCRHVRRHRDSRVRFSLGLERILVVMQERGMFPPHVEQPSVDVVVAALDERAQGRPWKRPPSFGTARFAWMSIRRSRRRWTGYSSTSISASARFIAILGEDEVAAGTVTVSNVATKTKETMPRAEVASFIIRALSNEPRASARLARALRRGSEHQSSECGARASGASSEREGGPA